MNKTNNVNPLWTPTRVAFTVLVLSLFAALGISSCSSGDERRANPPAPGVATESKPVNPSAPPVRVAPQPVITLPASVTDVELRAVSGAPIKLSNYAGKVLVVNLWATWCGPCRLETPELVKLHQEFRSQGVEVVGLSTETYEESAQSVPEFVHNYNVDYRVGWATPDVALTLMQGRESIPQSFVITRDGKILKRFVGFSPTATPPKLREALEDALAAKG